jgi:hypothetical protein
MIIKRIGVHNYIGCFLFTVILHLTTEKAALTLQCAIFCFLEKKLFLIYF